MATRRIEKIKEMLRREVSEIIQRDMKDPAIGFTTVSRAEVSKDLTYASIFVSVMGEEKIRKTTIKRLNKAVGYIQHQLSEKTRLRTMPKITFKLDESIDYSMKIEGILKKIAEEKTEEVNTDEQEQ